MDVTIVWQKNWDAIHAKAEDGSRKYRYIVNRGSSRSSKTFSLIDCYDLYARASKNKRLTVWRDTKIDCKQTVLADVLKRLKQTDRFKVNQTFNITESVFTYSTGSAFEIHGTDDDIKVHGLTQDCAWLNEPYKISKAVFDQIDQRTADFIFIDMNPKQSHWVEDLIKDPRTIVIDSTFKDNPFCPPESRIKILNYQPVSYCKIVADELAKHPDEKAGNIASVLMDYDMVLNPNNYGEIEIKELSRCRENHAKNTANEYNWSVYGLGIKAEKPNRIFNWARVSIEDYYKIDSQRYYGCDWGTVDPWAIAEAKYYDGNLYLHELNYDSENQWRERLGVTELTQINAVDSGREDKVGIVTWLFSKLSIPKDRPVVCDTNRPIKGAALRNSGWQAIPALKVPGSIIDGIDELSNLKVFYTSSSANIEYEQENYSREIDKYGVVQEEPIDCDNHQMDVARYIVLHLISIGVIKRK